MRDRRALSGPGGFLRAWGGSCGCQSPGHPRSHHLTRSSPPGHERRRGLGAAGGAAGGAAARCPPGKSPPVRVRPEPLPSRHPRGPLTSGAPAPHFPSLLHFYCCNHIKLSWGYRPPPKGPEPPSHGAQGLFPVGNPWYSGSVGVWGLPRGVTLFCLCPPQILALGQEGVLQELVLGVGQPPEPGELFLLPLDQSQCFLVGKSPGGLGRTPGIK